MFTQAAFKNRNIVKYYYNVKVLTDSSDQFNASLLNKIMNFLSENSYWPHTFVW